MNREVQIVERGRGPQLSTSRITVQDLVPYLQKKWTYEQIMVAMPILTVADIQVVERYIRENYDAVMEADRRIRERNAARKTPPEIEEIARRGGEKMAALRRNSKGDEKNGSATVINLVSDADIQGHVAYLVSRMQGHDWREFWEHFDVRCLSFAEIGLSRDDSDAIVWNACQLHQAFLLTANRNDDGPDSLEATIRACNTPQSLPVFTIGDPDSVLSSKEYADRVIDRLFRYLFEIDNIRGTGRLFLPGSVL